MNQKKRSLCQGVISLFVLSFKDTDGRRTKLFQSAN